MNHKAIYDAIIENAKLQNRNRRDGNYYESHHILPKCLNGSDKKENRVLLTAKEHYICHKLLTYIYKGNRKIINAFYYMSYNKRYVVSSREYVYIKELITRTPVSEETRSKQSNIRKGRSCTNKEYFCAKGRKFSKTHKDNLSIAKMGEKNPMYGKPAWDAINIIKKKCEYCGIETTLGNYSRWHGNRCKHKI